MALTKVSDSLLNQPLDLSVKGINSSGVITATSAILSGSVVATAGTVTANQFYGDGSNLTGVSGFGNAVSNDPTTGGNQIFKVGAILTIGAGTSMLVQSDEDSGYLMFTRARDVRVASGATLSVGSGTTFKTNIMGLSQGLF